MPNIDLDLDQLWSYQPQESEPADFADFWQAVLSEARQEAPGTELVPAGPKLAGAQAYRLSFQGIGGTPIAGWYVRPDGDGPFPGIVHYHGYSGRGARPLEMYNLAAQGIALLSMDCRGQGGGSPDAPISEGHHAGWLTKGLSDPGAYYYRHVFADAVLAIDALASFVEVDEGRLATMGASQGGALSLVAAALSQRTVFTWADIPFLCDFRRSVEISPAAPFTEISSYLRRHPQLTEQAFATLAYFDVVNHARRVNCPARVTVGLWDEICPPSGIFAAYNRVPAPDKQLVIMPYTGHELFYETEEQRFSETVSRLAPA